MEAARETSGRIVRKGGLKNVLKILANIKNSTYRYMPKSLNFFITILCIFLASILLSNSCILC
jgi:hypothetical protein